MAKTYKLEPRSGIVQRPLNISCVFLVALLLAACSGLQFAYNRLDWLIAQQLDNFVSLTDSQEALLSSILERQLHWHRGKQLPVYALLLQQLRTNLAAGLALEDVDIYEAELRSIYAELVQQLMPDASQLLATLNEDQISELMTALEKRNRQYHKQQVAISTAEHYAKSVKRTLKQIERWLGEVTAQQRQHVEQWAMELEFNGAETLAYRQRWQDTFVALLQQRQAPNFQVHLGDLVLTPEAFQSPILRDQRQRNLQRYKQLLLDIYALTTTAQRKFLDDRLQSLAGDFNQLAVK